MKKIIFCVAIVCCMFSCNNSNSDLEEIVVIGGGLMGSSAAWHLSNYGENLVLLEKQDALYTQGSSYGETRIARSNNRGNDIWSYLHNRSVAETEELIQYLNDGENSTTYAMEDIYTTSPVTYVGRIGIYDKLMASLERQKVDYKIASTPQQGVEIFNINLADSVLIQREYNKHSGTVNPKTLINYLHKAILNKGNEVRYNQTVNSIEKHSEYYEIKAINNITSEQYSIRSKKVVCAAGPYTGSLLKDLAPYFDTLIQPQRVFLSFLQIKDEKFRELSAEQKQRLADAYPVINSSTGTRNGSFFSMVEGYANGNPMLKIGGHFQRSDIEDMDEVWQKEISADEIEWSKNGTSRYFDLLNLPLSGEDLEVKDGYSCVYSLSSTEVPYVTPLHVDETGPDNTFIILGAMSGVGAKGAMTYGLIGANLLTDKSESNANYQVVVNALGYDRLVTDLK